MSKDRYYMVDQQSRIHEITEPVYPGSNGSIDRIISLNDVPPAQLSSVKKLLVKKKKLKKENTMREKNEEIEDMYGCNDCTLGEGEPCTHCGVEEKDEAPELYRLNEEIEHEVDPRIATEVITSSAELENIVPEKLQYMIFNYGMAMYRAGQMTNKSKEEVDQFIQPAGFNVNAEI